LRTRDASKKFLKEKTSFAPLSLSLSLQRFGTVRGTAPSIRGAVGALVSLHQCDRSFSIGKKTSATAIHGESSGGSTEGGWLRSGRHVPKSCPTWPASVDILRGGSLNLLIESRLPPVLGGVDETGSARLRGRVTSRLPGRVHPLVARACARVSPPRPSGWTLMPAPGRGRRRGRGESGRRIGIPRRIPFSQCHFDRTVSGSASSFDEATASRRHLADLRNRDDPTPLDSSCRAARRGSLGARIRSRKGLKRRRTVRNPGDRG